VGLRHCQFGISWIGESGVERTRDRALVSINPEDMDSKSKKTSVTHKVYTETDFHEETHKGRKPLLLRNDRQSFKFCTSSLIEHQLNVRLLPLFYKLQLV
jgi:hypothetical protein